MLLPCAASHRASINHQRFSRAAAASVHLAETSQANVPVTTVKQFGFAQDFQQRYELGALVGQGTFGRVYEARDRATQERVAVKCVTKRILGGSLESNFVRRVQHEVDIYNHVGRSLNVAYLYGAYEDATRVQLVLELCSGGELWDRIRRGYSERQAARLCLQVLQTLAQCHAKGVVLRDVKPENFLFLDHSEDAPLKMIDFGLAEYCKPGQVLSDRAGTPLYVAPEVLKQRYNTQADVWSAGVMAYQLLSGRFPFEDEDNELLASSLDVTKKTFSNREVFNAILYNPLDFMRAPWDRVSPLATSFVQALLQRDPSQRLTAEEAMQHPWIRSCLEPEPLRTSEPGTLRKSEQPGTLRTLVPPASSGADLHAPGKAYKLPPPAAAVAGASSAAAEHPISDTIVQRLQRYGTYGRLKQLGLRAMAGYVPLDSLLVQQLRREFSSLDPLGSGKVQYQQVSALLTSGAFDLSPVEVRQLMSQFHIDPQGCIDYQEWLAALIDWREIQNSPQWQEWVNKAFDQFDTSGAGRLSALELAHVLCAGEGGVGPSGEDLDECAIPDTVPAVLREADNDHDGSLSREEFVALLRSPPSERLDLYASRLRQRPMEDRT